MDAPVRAYITTSAFSGRIFSYATSFNSSTYETTGTLTALGSDISSGKNVAGIVLRENGKKLYPGVNPGIVTYMVGVYYNSPDTALTFSGFIDPNDSVYAPFNTDKPYFLEDAKSFTVSAGVATVTGLDTGAPLIGTNIVLQKPTTLTQSTTTALEADCKLGSVFYVTISTNDNFNINAINVTPGQIVTFILNNTGAANTPTITFGTNIRAGGTLLITTGKQATSTFIGYPSATPYIMEIARIAAIDTA